jgi:hypothetical protein
MSAQRPLGLLVVLLVAIAAALVLERSQPAAPPEVPLVGLRAEDIRGIRIRESSRELRAVREGSRWRVVVPPGARADAGEAVRDLVDALVTLVPVDTFTRRQIDRRPFGLDPERTRIELEIQGATEPVVLLLGDHVPTGGSIYGALGSDSRVYQIGVLVLSEIERVFYRTRPKGGGDA